MNAVLGNVRANHPFEGEESEVENDELQQIDTLGTTVGKVTYKDKLYFGKTKVDVGNFALTVEVEETPIEIMGPLGMEHTIVTTAKALREAGTQKIIQIRELKKKVVSQERIAKEVEAAHLIVEDISMQVNLNTGIAVVKEEWTKSLLDAIMRLFLNIANFYIEENG